MTTFMGVLIFLLSYLFGSMPSGYLIGKFNGIDIRKHGSKNIGATNVRRTLGRDWSIVCFLMDFFKGALAVWIVGRNLGGTCDIGVTTGAFIAAIAAILGHVFPVWLGFKGGKAVATALGVACALAFIPLLIGAVTWLLIFEIKRIVSLASMGAVVAMALAMFIFQLCQWHASGWPCVWLFVIIAAIVIIRHKDNIVRLKNGTESVFKRPSKNNDEA